jgi:hypothetical protein
MKITTAYYSLPPSRADMDVIKKVQTSNGSKVNITEEIIEISYEYSEFNNCNMTNFIPRSVRKCRGSVAE